MQPPKAVLLALTALLTTPTFAQQTTTTSLPGQQPQPSLATSTATTPSASATTLPQIVSQLPACAIPCLSTAANAISCAPSNFTCLCDASKAQSFALNVGTCIGGAKLFGRDEEAELVERQDQEKDGEGCELSDLPQLEKLARELCTAVNSGSVKKEEMDEAKEVVEGMIEEEGGGDGKEGEDGKERENEAGRARARAGTGMLAVVMAYAVFVL